MALYVLPTCTCTCMSITLYHRAATVCPELPDPLNGFVTFTMENVPLAEVDMTPPFDFMTVAVYECNIGYGLFGGDTMRTCGGIGPTGNWNGTAPTCQRT